jgi:PAS domain S-box-containing protein
MQVPFFNSLRFKVGVGYIVLVAINIAATSWAIFNFNRLTNSLKSVLYENYPNVIVVENMARSVERHEDAISRMLTGDVNDGKIQFMEAKDEFYQLFHQAKENQDLPDAKPILENVRSTYEGYLLVTDSLTQLALHGDVREAKSFYYNTVRPFSQRLTDNCFWLIEENQVQMNSVAAQTKTTSDEAIIAILFASFLATALSIATMIRFTKRIIEPAERLTETVHKIGRGRLDLKLDINTNDEVGELSREFNKMTERLRKFEELNIEKILSEKKKSETIVESISDAIIVCDSDLNIQLMNHSAEQLLNVNEHEVLGKPLDQSVSDERVLKIFRRRQDPQILNQPYILFQHNNRYVYMRPRVSDIPAPHGQSGGVVLVLQDVTQFKELDKMKSDFMAAVSHEFRTPLTSINMGVDILRQQLIGPLTKAQEELLNSSKQDCERLTKLVRELLQLSKLESGKIELRTDQVSIQKIIESTLQPLRLPFQQKGVTLLCTMGDELPLLIGDEQQFSWIISNLVSNALRYTDTGGVVEVQAISQTEHVLVSVKDTGRGIAPEHIGKIFDKFVQVKQSSDTTPGSVGLGLAIAKEIVEMYGGKIWVESKLGKGSTFYVQLPAIYLEHA